MKKIYSILLRPILAFFYIVGLSFIIPFFLSTSLPEEIAVKYNSIFFLIGSIILISISIIGTLFIKETLSKTLKSLAYYSLIPGLLSILTTIFGKDFLTKIFNSKTLEPIITAYLNARIPKLWFLAVAYISLGIILYFIGEKIK